MALTRGQKAAALGNGAAVGGGTTAALGAAVGATMRGVASVAPAVASVASKALPVLAVSYAAGSAVVAGVRSAKRGESAAEVAKHAALGAVGLDSIAIPKTSTRVEFEMKHGKPMGLGGPKDDSSNKTIAERQKELAEKNGAGGDPAVYKKIAENSRKQMAKAKTNAERNAQERRALLAEEKYEKLTGEHIGPTKPEPKQEAAKPGPAVVEEVKPGEGFGSRMLRKAEAAVENTLFGPGKPKAEDAMAKERAQLEKAAGETRARLDDEFKNRGGAGPKYDKLKKEADEASGKLAELTKKQTEKEAEEAAGYRQLGAMVTGAAVGVWLGGMTKKAAANAAKVAEKGINQLADKAQKLVNSAPKGVIKGTVEGDKAAAAVAAAKSASSKPLVTNAEAYALPALNVAHGGVAIGLAKSDPDSPAAPLLRAEGTAAIVAGVVGAKYGLAARAMRATVSPNATAKITAAEKRLNRETRGGPAGVAQAKGRAAVATAKGEAGVASAKASRAAGVAAARGGASVDKAKIGAAADVGIAKAKAASAVEVAEIRGKQAASRQMKRGHVSGYKDTWVVKRKGKKAVVAHRKDMSVRSRKGGGVANDNAATSSRSAS